MEDCVLISRRLFNHHKLYGIAKHLVPDGMAVNQAWMHVAMGGCIQVWSFAVLHGELVNGELAYDDTEPHVLDCQVALPGLSRGMLDVGWLRIDGSRLVFTNYGVDFKSASHNSYRACEDNRIVYFIVNHSTGLVKIGSSRDAQKRLSQLQTGAGGNLELLSTCPGGTARERELHETFDELRVHGEWFSNVGPLRDFIIEVTG